MPRRKRKSKLPEGARVKPDPAAYVFGFELRSCQRGDFFFRVDPIPKNFQDAVTRKLLDFFGASAEDARRPLTRRATTILDGVDYELIAQTLPSPHGIRSEPSA